MAVWFVLISCLGWMQPTLAAPFEPLPDYAESIMSLDTLKGSRTEASHVTDELPSWYSRRSEEMELRRTLIRHKILDMLNLSCLPQPPWTLSSQRRHQIAHLLDRAQNNSADHPTGNVLKRALSLYPSCDMPDEQDGHWPPLPSLRIYFNVTSVFTAAPPQLVVEAAELGVFKNAHTVAALRPADATLAPSQPPTLRVSVYTRVHEARKETGSTYNGTLRVAVATVPLSAALWVRLDVRRAVRLWQAGHPNTGLYLVVQNARGRRLDPALFFQPITCDVAMPEIPVPRFLLEADDENTTPVTGDAEDLPYPLLDLQTAQPADGWLQMAAPAAAVAAAPAPPCQPPAAGRWRGNGRRLRRHLRRRQRRHFRRRGQH